MLRLKTKHLEQIRRHLQDCYPLEGCGILLGQAGENAKQVQRVLIADNEQARESQRRYLIPASAVRSAEVAGRSQGLEIVGFFHSHPDVEAAPSEFDCHHAWPWYSYLIVSVSQGGCRNALCWTLRDDRSGFDPEPVEIVDRASSSDP